MPWHCMTTVKYKGSVPPKQSYIHLNKRWFRKHLRTKTENKGLKPLWSSHWRRTSVFCTTNSVFCSQWERCHFDAGKTAKKKKAFSKDVKDLNLTTVVDVVLSPFCFPFKMMRYISSISHSLFFAVFLYFSVLPSKWWVPYVSR